MSLKHIPLVASLIVAIPVFAQMNGHDYTKDIHFRLTATAKNWCVDNSVKVYSQCREFGYSVRKSTDIQHGILNTSVRTDDEKRIAYRKSRLHGQDLVTSNEIAGRARGRTSFNHAESPAYYWSVDGQKFSYVADSVCLLGARDGQLGYIQPYSAINKCLESFSPENEADSQAKNIRMSAPEYCDC